MMQRAPEPSLLAVLRVVQVAAQADGRDKGVSLARLGKHLGQSASALLRTLAPVRDAATTDQPGLAWITVNEQAGRYTVVLTEAGEAALRAHDLGLDVNSR